jgi:hypothetical protein
MRRARIAAVCVLWSGELGCVATTRGTVAADHATSLAAASTAAHKLGMDVVVAPPLYLQLSDEAFPFIWRRTGVVDADLFVTAGAAEHLTQGAVQLTASGPDLTECEGIFATNPEVSPSDMGAMFLELTNQQVRLDAGTQLPHVNPLKSAGRYAAWTLCTPVAGLHYTGTGNPYWSSDPALGYAGAALGDAVMVGCLTAAFLVDGRDTRSTLIAVGVSTGMAWRFYLSLLGLNDIKAYNFLARSDDDLEAALRAIHAQENHLKR